MKQTHNDCSPKDQNRHEADAPTLKNGERPSGCRQLELPSHEVLSQLARNDIEAYEKLRRQVIEEFINGAPARHKRRLRGLQFRVDGERRLSRSPLGSTVKIYQLMWESFLSLNGRWQDFTDVIEHGDHLHEPTPTTECQAQGSAQILEFRPRPSREQDGR